jgi:sulfotransferase family protein
VQIMAVRDRTLMMDNSRWDGFELRPSDIVISTPPKSGTTWTQMLCAMLIFDGPDFPAPLGEVSPWLDQTLRPLDEVRALYAAQGHRRFIKTHTPLDGLPLRDDVTYIVVGRDPRDVMISMEHHVANMDLAGLPPRPEVSDDPAERFRTFVDGSAVGAGVVNLSGVMHHLDTAWQLRHCPNVVFCHYADLSADLPGEIVRLGTALDIEVTRDEATTFAAEATLERMRDRAEDVLPNAGTIWKDDRAFFRAGGFGEWRARADEEALAEYDRKVGAITSPDLATWAHLGRLASGIDPATHDLPVSWATT